MNLADIHYIRDYLRICPEESFSSFVDFWNDPHRRSKRPGLDRVAELFLVRLGRIPPKGAR